MVRIQHKIDVIKCYKLSVSINTQAQTLLLSDHTDGQLYAKMPKGERPKVGIYKEIELFSDWCKNPIPEFI